MPWMQTTTVNAYNLSSSDAAIMVAHRSDGTLTLPLITPAPPAQAWRTPESTVYFGQDVGQFDPDAPQPSALTFALDYEAGPGAGMDYWYVLVLLHNGGPLVYWSLGGNTLRPAIAMKIPDDGQINIEISDGPSLAVYPGPMSGSVVGVQMSTVTDTYIPAQRKEVGTLTADERAAYVAAVQALKRAPSRLDPPTDNRYNDYVLLHMLAMGDVRVRPGSKLINNDAIMSVTTRSPAQMWAHQGPQFLAWHREYLRQFELDLFRVTQQRIGIPYWDWTVNRAVDGIPWLPDFMGGDGEDGPVTSGPFAGKAKWQLTLSSDEAERRQQELVRGFGRAPGAANLPTDQNVRDTLARTPYDAAPFSADPALASFRNQIEGWHVPAGQTPPGMHDLVHDWVGGTSGTMLYGSSPNDPVFFLHHSNIDRLWAVWQQMHPTEPFYAPAKPVEGADALAANQPMIFKAADPAVMSKAPWPGPPATPGQMIHHHDLNYYYDRDGQPPPSPSGPTLRADVLAAGTPAPRPADVRSDLSPDTEAARSTSGKHRTPAASPSCRPRSDY